MRAARFVGAMVAAGVLSAGVLCAQQGKPLQFEVASIKPGDPKAVNSSTSGGGPGGQFRMVNTPLRQWVEMGLSVRDYALKAPPWLESARFDLEARMPSAPADRKAIPSQDPRSEMMKALLIERFGLKWHEEMQTVSGFELVADKKVLLKPASMLERMRGLHGTGSGNGTINGTNMSMADLAGLLGDSLGKPVVDATHLSGGFDIQLRWVPEDDAAAAEQRKYGKQYGVDVDSLPSSVTTALREQLGLRLQSAKVPLKVIVVDHMNNQPTGN